MHMPDFSALCQRRITQTYGKGDPLIPPCPAARTLPDADATQTGPATHHFEVRPKRSGKTVFSDI